MNRGPSFSAFTSHPDTVLSLAFLSSRFLCAAFQKVFAETAFFSSGIWLLSFRTATAFHCSKCNYPLTPPQHRILL